MPRRTSPDGKWIGRLFIGDGRLIYAGRVGVTQLHAHHTFQLVLAVDGAITLGDARGHSVDCQSAVVPPNTAHAVLSSTKAILVHVASDAPSGRGLRALVDTDASISDWVRAGARLEPVRRSSATITSEDADRFAVNVCEALLGSPEPPPPLHPAVRRALRLLPGLLDEDVRLEALAARVGLSASRLSHLFRSEVGTALRPYVLWLRMQRVAECLARGRSLTVAAHEAGFVDSAHLNHVFQRMFGFAPSTLSGSIEWVLPRRRLR